MERFDWQCEGELGGAKVSVAAKLLLASTMTFEV